MPSSVPFSAISFTSALFSAGCMPASARASRITPIIGEMWMPIGQIMSQRPHWVQAS